MILFDPIDGAFEDVRPVMVEAKPKLHLPECRCREICELAERSHRAEEYACVVSRGTQRFKPNEHARATRSAIERTNKGSSVTSMDAAASRFS
ncbi:MAG: hypothetical protein H6817_07370 [Phycisphaerales bacterium]|nr:hypothetical protein [Phycisphaerales bacterium]